MTICGLFLCFIFVLVIMASTTNTQENQKQEQVIQEEEFDAPPLIEVGHESIPEYKKDQVPKFIIELEDFPQEIFEKFKKENKADVIKSEWENEMYGGSVLDPIVNFETLTDGNKFEKRIPNYLRDDLEEIAAENVSCRHFNLKNVFIHEKRDHAFFADISILITGELDHDDVQRLTELEDQFEGTFQQNHEKYLKDKGAYEDSFTRMDDIAHLLSGYGRFIFYDAYGSSVIRSDGSREFNPLVDAQQNKISQIKEGHFYQSFAEGYGRILDLVKQVKVGYWKEDWAYGKMQHYQDGKMLEQGIYDELNFDDDESLIEKEEIITFETNVDPLELLDEIDLENKS